MHSHETPVERVAAIYDLHGNLPALQAVLAEIERIGPELVVVGGDIATGPMPRETLDAVMALGDRARVIHGNADRELVAIGDALDRGDDLGERSREVDIWAARQITLAERALLTQLPGTLTLDIAGLGRTLFCHGSPRSDEEIITDSSPEDRLKPMLAGLNATVVVCGLTHVQFDRVVGETCIVNAGSVGMPYEDQPGAYWALLGPTVELRRTEYDFDRAADFVRATGMPGADEHARENTLSPPSAGDATAYFEQLASARDAAAGQLS